MRLAVAFAVLSLAVATGRMEDSTSTLSALEKSFAGVLNATVKPVPNPPTVASAGNDQETPIPFGKQTDATESRSTNYGQDELDANTATTVCADGEYKDPHAMQDGNMAGNHDTACKPCPKGWYSDMTTSPATESAGAGCQKCAIGQFTHLEKQSSCLTCPEGFTTYSKDSAPRANDDWYSFRMNTRIEDAQYDLSMPNNYEDQTLDQCKNQCAQRDECLSFSWNRDTKECQLKDKCVKATERYLAREGRVTTFGSLSLGSSAESGATLESCMDGCDLALDCNSFAFDEASGKCELSQKCVTKDDPVGGGSGISYYTQTCANTSQYIALEKSIQNPGDECTTKPEDTAAQYEGKEKFLLGQCQNACDFVDDCNAFVWSETAETCKLYTGCPPAGAAFELATAQTDDSRYFYNDLCQADDHWSTYFRDCREEGLCFKTNADPLHQYDNRPHHDRE